MDTKNEEIMVSVICMCYNHEKYIKDALESFVNQKTSFKYEVFVHDDASTDNSARIIREYEKKYPEIIKPIYQTENQHSQGVKSLKTYILPKVSGKYLAFCEGDDYWTCENKLQKQVDFLESHPDFSVCVHSTEVEYMSTNEIRVRLPADSREIKLEDILDDDKRYHLSSVLIHKDFYIKRPQWTQMVPGIGDLPTSIYYILSGRVMYFGEVMSHYRYGVLGSWTHRQEKSPKKQITDNKNIVKMLKAADKYYEYKYSKTFKKLILKYKYCVIKAYIKRFFPFLAAIKK